MLDWKSRLLFSVLFGALFVMAPREVIGASFTNFEGKQTRPIALSPDGTKLFAVNTPDARVSVFDITNPSNPILISEIPVGLEPASVQPRSNDEVWVVNELSDSVSVVSIPRAVVTDTIPVKDEPADVVFANGKAFVSVGRSNRIDVFDEITHAHLGSIPLQGENPRALAVSSDGSLVYVAFALSGNGTTLIPPSVAPPPPPPTVVTNPAPQVGLIVAADDPTWSATIQYTMPDHDVAEIDTATLAVTRYFDEVGTVNLGLAVRPTNGFLYVANTEALNLIRFEPNLRGHFIDNRISRISTLDGSVTAFDLNLGLDYATLPNPTALATSLAQPTAVAFDGNVDVMYIAAFGSDRIARVDPDGNVLARIDIGPVQGAATDPSNKRGPRGLAVHPSAQLLYVLNRIANTIMVVDLSSDMVTRELPAGSNDPTPAVIKNGRGFLYDARLSGNGTVSCAGCHIDAEMDMLAWDLGDPAGSMVTVTSVILSVPVSFDMHPMKGPMTTQTLRGLKDLDPLHWRGDRNNFLEFNPTFNNLMGGPTLAPADMDAFREFIETIAFQPNPNQNLDRTLPASFEGADPVAGRDFYINENYASTLKCNDCHTANPGNGSNNLIIPASALQESQDFKVPHLRNAYKKRSLNKTPGAESIGGFGFLHDGEIPSVFDFLTLPVFDLIDNNSIVKSNLSAFVHCFDTGMAPTVGYGRTLDAGNKNDADIIADCGTLEAQAAVSNINLIVKGRIDDTVRSYVYDPVANRYVSDVSDDPPLTRAELLALVLNDSVLSVTGVPPGSGNRMALDRNEDGIRDGDAAPPALDSRIENGSPIISWSTNEYWYVLESSDDSEAGAWSTVTEVRAIDGSDVIVTNNAPDTAVMFRLRRPW